MFANKKKPTDFRDCYATCADFCEVFQSDEKQFYLLTFLLTADAREAEACFLAAMEESVREKNVFKGWEKSWSKRCVIRKAIGMLASRSLCRDQQLEIGCQPVRELQLGTLLRAVVRLEPAERVVFVATVLERYSVQECALLIGRPPESVKKLKVQAIRHVCVFVGERIPDVGLAAPETGRQWGTAPQRRKRRTGRYLNSSCFASIWRANRLLHLVRTE